MENIPLWVALGAGLLSFLSPCVLPLVPVYFGSLCGPEILEPEGRRRRIPVFLHSLSFVIGFTIAFTVMGAGAGLAGFAIDVHQTLIRRIAGIFLISLGLYMLASLKIPRLNFEKRLTPSKGTATSYVRSFLTGGVFSLAWIPCVSPILGGILTLAWASETAWHGALLLAIYSLGLGIPFLIIGAAFDSITPILKRIRRHSMAIYISGGVLLIVVGILTLTNRLVVFSTIW